jgi:hypothetical protein
LNVNLWDRWDVQIGKNPTVKELLEYLASTYKLIPRDIMIGTTPIYLHAIFAHEDKKQEKEKVLASHIRKITNSEVNNST